MEPDDPQPKPVRVTIFHQPYTLLASEDGARVEELAQMVDELMHSIADKAVQADSSRVAVLACLHLADKFRTLESELADLRQRVESKSKQFSMLLDRVME
jgi:cell division protein ZapA